MRTIPSLSTPWSLLVAGAIAIASPAVADVRPQKTVAPPTIVTSGKPASNIKVRGQVVRMVRWFDDAGRSVEAVFSTLDGPGSRALQVDLLEHVGAKKWKRLRTIKDRVANCDADLMVDFEPATIGLADLDADGLGELTFAYTVGCASDVSPIPRKLVVLEGKAKYILRGTTRVDPGDGAVGGQFKAEPAPSRWPTGTYAHATKVWETTHQR